MQFPAGIQRIMRTSYVSSLEASIQYIPPPWVFDEWSFGSLGVVPGELPIESVESGSPDAEHAVGPLTTLFTEYPGLPPYLTRVIVAQAHSCTISGPQFLQANPGLSSSIPQATSCVVRYLLP